MSRLPKPLVNRVAEMVAAGFSIMEIRSNLHVGYATIARILANNGAKPNVSSLGLSHTYRSRMEAVAPEQWDAWRAAKATLLHVGKLIDVPAVRLSRWARANGKVFWPGVGGGIGNRKWSSNAERQAAHRRNGVQPKPSRPRPPYTWEEYYDQREAEFGHPVFSRKAPEMLAAIEAWQRQRCLKAAQ